MVFGEVYRNGAEWKFRPSARAIMAASGPLPATFGVNF
jgi:stress response protein SCP2